MGEIRKHTTRNRWTDRDIQVLTLIYSTGSHEEILEALPGRDLRSIQCKANWLGLTREKKPKRTAEQVREAKRRYMAEKRAADPQSARDYRNAYHVANRDVQTAKMRAYYERRFFWTKAMKLRGGGRATAQDLAAIWKAQRGRCALTGRRLDRSAQLDHKLPRARGGSDEPSNLQWLCEEANLAKRAMTDAEFAALCCEVMAWIGSRIQQVAAIQGAEVAA